MSTAFMLLMAVLNLFASAALFWDGRVALGICYLCYAIATIAMTKV